jgi:hypothetical protein
MSSTTVARRRWFHIYALLTGVLGVSILALLFVHQDTPLDLPALLLFTLVALIVSYFKIPIGRRDIELGLDGAVLLGATLVGGAAFGGWTAFVTGLIPSFRPHMRWVDRSATALLDSGRKVIAVSVAWLAYQGMGGRLSPIVDTQEALALIVLCTVYGVLHCLWSVPARRLESAPSRQTLGSLIDLTTLMVELLPLPIALLISVTFVRLGLSSFLVLALVFIGLSAVMRRMQETMNGLQAQIDALTLADRLQQAITDCPRQVDALCALGYDFCTHVVATPRFEIGLFESVAARTKIASGQETEDPLSLPTPSSPTHVRIPVSVDGSARLPAMRIPITPQWLWLSERREPYLGESEAHLARLPFALPPIERTHEIRSALLVPLQHTSPREDLSPEAVAPPGTQATDTREAEPKAVGRQATEGQAAAGPAAKGPQNGLSCASFGAIVVGSPHPNAFSPRDARHIVLIADRLSTAILKAQAGPEPPPP